MSERILILDDDDQLARAYQEHLSASGYEVDCAQEPEEAETLFAHFPYSVVVTDLRLSRLGFGGLDFIKHLRQMSSQIPIIVLTGYNWPELEAEVLSYKIDAVLKKPTRIHDLAETIAITLGAAV